MNYSNSKETEYITPFNLQPINSTRTKSLIASCKSSFEKTILKKKKEKSETTGGRANQKLLKKLKIKKKLYRKIIPPSLANYFKSGLKQRIRKRKKIF